MTAQMVKQSLNTDLWHRKLAHFNMKTVLRNLKLNSIDYTNNQTECLDCLNGKAHSSKIKTPKREYDVLELIESDSTPFPITSYDGFSYSLKFVDTKSGYIHTSFIRDLKSRTILDDFKSFKSRVERFSNKRLKILRTDGGSEYKGVLNDFLISEGIIKQTGAPTRKHIPARAERAHRTILELARCSHSYSKLPLKFYSDAHRYASYTINRIIRDGESKSPYEQIYGRTPNLENLHVFGSLCWAFVPKEKRHTGKL